MTDSPKKEGQIITFYSYKGGVGRSRALANTAYQLARNGKEVLCIDFDLEAPGLIQYFRKWIEDEETWNELQNRPGVIDIFYSYQEYILLTNPFREIMNWKNLITSIEIPDESKLFSLDFIGPGRQGDDYGKRVVGFDWKVFYEKLEGGNFIEHLRDQFRKAYDFVLIDSRTGLSDIGGICAIQFPTILIIVFSSSPQSVRGLETILPDIESRHRRLRTDQPIPIIPLPCRIDRREEKEEYDRWFAHVSEGRIGNRLNRINIAGQNRIENLLQRITIDYFAWYSFRDDLESELESIDDVGANAWKYKNLIDLINTESIQLETLSESATRPHETAPLTAIDATEQWDKLSGEQNTVNDNLENVLDSHPGGAQTETGINFHDVFLRLEKATEPNERQYTEMK